MPGSGINIYQSARLSAGFTQEQAAEELYASVRTVAAWEQGERVPDNKTVAKMTALYGDTNLKLYRILDVLAELQVYIDDGVIRSLPTAIISQWDLLNEVLSGYRHLIHIMADGVVDESEQADYTSICNLILLNSIAGLKVVLCQPNQPAKKDRPTAASVRRPVQGLASENECKNIISPPAGNASPFLRKGAKL